VSLHPQRAAGRCEAVLQAIETRSGAALLNGMPRASARLDGNPPLKGKGHACARMSGRETCKQSGTADKTPSLKRDGVFLY
jgi:hypothetical protein